MIAAREQARARGRADRRGVEVVVAQTVGRQAIERGCPDVGAVAAELRVAHVVEQQDEHVGRAFACAARPRPCRLDVAAVRPIEPVKAVPSG